MSEWIEWKGGECPVPRGCYYAVRLRDGLESSLDLHAPLRWTHLGHSGDIVAYCVVDPAPDRKHVSDAAWEAYQKYASRDGTIMMERGFMETAHSHQGTVLLTVAEHDELIARLADKTAAFECAMKQVADAQDLARRAIHDRDALRAEVAAQRDHILMMADHIDAMIEQDRIAWDQIERLRKERDDGTDMGRERFKNPGMDIARCSVSARGVGLLAGADFQLDPRLGTQLPDGEPVAPMSQRKPYRWGMV